MRFIKKFDQNHYKVYLSKINLYVRDMITIDEYVKSLSDRELKIWIALIEIFEFDDKEYYEEMSMLLTIIIRFFIIELNVDLNKIELKNSQINKIFLNFKYIIYREYSNRNNISNYKKEVYYLLR